MKASTKQSFFMWALSAMVAVCTIMDLRLALLTGTFVVGVLLLIAAVFAIYDWFQRDD